MRLGFVVGGEILVRQQPEALLAASRSLELGKMSKRGRMALSPLPYRACSKPAGAIGIQCRDFKLVTN